MIQSESEKGTVGAVVDNINDALLLLIPFMTSVNSWRNRRTKRCGYAYEAKDIAETTIFVGCRSSGARTHLMAIQEAMVEALFKAKERGFQSIIVLTGSKEQAKIANLHHLRQQGVCSTLWLQSQGFPFSIKIDS
uniref:Uncharacterized protein n=1 Tax=Quercus lobata TaxID=97700 RepID=A0A7N2LHI4_QUELO